VDKSLGVRQGDRAILLATHNSLFFAAGRLLFVPKVISVVAQRLCSLTAKCATSRFVAFSIQINMKIRFLEVPAISICPICGWILSKIDLFGNLLLCSVRFLLLARERIYCKRHESGLCALCDLCG